MRLLILTLLFVSLQSQGQVINASAPYRAATAVTSTIAYVGGADGGHNGGTGNLTYSYTVGSGTYRALVVGITGDTGPGGDNITSVTYNGVAMTFINKIYGAGGGRWTYLYYLLNPASGAHNVVISISSNHYLMSGIMEYTGVAGIDANSTSGNHNTTSLTSTLVTTVDNSWGIVYISSNGTSNGISAGSGLVKKINSAINYFSMFNSNGPITPTQSYGMTTTSVSNDAHIHCAVILKPY